MDLLAFLSPLFQFVLVWRVFLALAVVYGVWWALDLVFVFGSGWIHSIPVVSGLLLGIFWYWRDPPPSPPPQPVQALRPRAAFLGAALCWAAALALLYVRTEGEDNFLAIPGAIFFAVFGAVCVMRGIEARGEPRHSSIDRDTP